MFRRYRPRALSVFRCMRPHVGRQPTSGPLAVLQAGMEKGRVAIFDATNVTRKFRCEMVEELRSVVQVRGQLGHHKPSCHPHARSVPHPRVAPPTPFLAVGRAASSSSLSCIHHRRSSSQQALSSLCPCSLGRLRTVPHPCSCLHRLLPAPATPHSSPHPLHTPCTRVLAMGGGPTCEVACAHGASLRPQAPPIADGSSPSMCMHAQGLLGPCVSGRRRYGVGAAFGGAGRSGAERGGPGWRNTVAR
jgi:hypothetical protein